MKFVSWNVNGLRACIQKGFLEAFQRLNADFFCLQETKLQAGQLTLELPGYHQYWNYAEKKGYSGTAVFTKHEPRAVSYGLGVPELDTEGRLITLEYDEFYLVTCYTPNAQRGLARLEHRLWWEEEFRKYVIRLDEKKPVILCGDLNVAHQEIDLKNPGPNRGSAGFSDQEREAFTKLLSSGFTDTFRHLHPDATGKYTWWSYMYKARENNAGWRIDYFLTSQRIRDRIFKTPIYSDIMGSDHCPVALELDTTCNSCLWSDEITDAPSAREPEKTPLPAMSPAVKAGVAAGIFAVGFAAGTMVKQIQPADAVVPGTTDIGFYVPEQTTPLETLPDNNNNPGILEDYASKSTQELANIAIRIDILSFYGERGMYMSDREYEDVKAQNPVLTELEQRADALHWLGMVSSYQSDLKLQRAANALRIYYSLKLDADTATPLATDPAKGEILIGETQYLKCFEQTQRMGLAFAAPSMVSSNLYPAFTAEDRWFMLEDADLRVNVDNVNFWVRIVPTVEVTGTFAPLITVDGVWLGVYENGNDWLRYAACRDPKEGGFIYGHVSREVQLGIALMEDGVNRGTQLMTGPIMDGLTTTGDLAQYLCQGLSRWHISDIGEFLREDPTAQMLLDRSNGVGMLLNLAIATSYEHRQSAFELLAQDAFQQKMTQSEKTRFQQINSNDFIFIGNMSPEPNLLPVDADGTKTDLWDDLSWNAYVKLSQEQLDAMELDQMDFWINAKLKPAGCLYYRPDWIFEMDLIPAQEDQNVSYLVLERYDSTGENFLGWIVCGKLNGPPVQGKFWLIQNGQALEESATMVYPTDYDYTLDGDIFYG